MERPTFRERMLRSREEAIVVSVNRLLAEKGFETMTMDEVAADVGIAKASLYKHFSSKEELAGAAMIRVVERALEHLDKLDRDGPSAEIDQLKAMTRWALEQQLAGEMPALPAQNSALRSALMANKTYLDRLLRLSDRLGASITAAQRAGDLNRELPPELVLYTLFARACDPVLSLLKASGSLSDQQIAAALISTCFDGLAGPRR
jgi:TetR/AcrR family transcriptional regulator of autoinduction and epiphytic fitness